jgi:hypothetical protein
MKYTIDTKRVWNFVRRHKEAIAVACIAAVVIHQKDKELMQMSSFIQDVGMMHDYNSLNQ